MNVITYNHPVNKNTTKDEEVAVGCMGYGSLGSGFQDLATIEAGAEKNKCAWTAWDRKGESCNSSAGSCQSGGTVPVPPADLALTAATSYSNATIALCADSEVMAGIRYYASDSTYPGTFAEYISILCCETRSEAGLESCTWGSTASTETLDPIQWSFYKASTGTSLTTKTKHHTAGNYYRCPKNNAMQGIAFTHDYGANDTYQEWVNIKCCSIYQAP